jgi:YVTN family beta-propeller protein
MEINTLMPELTVVTNTIENVGSIPVGLAFSPDGRKAYVVNGGENRVRVIDTETETVDDTLIRVGDQPQEIAINSAGTRAYVTNYGDGTVSVIDLETNTELTRIIVGGNPNGIAVRPGDAEVYVVNLGNNTVSIIETSTNSVVRRLTRLEVDGGIGLLPQKVAFSPDGKQAFITNSLDYTVTIIDTETREKLDTLFVGVGSSDDVINEPDGVFISPNGLRLYVSLFGRDGQGRYLIIFSANTKRIQAITEVGDGPIGIAVGGQ